METMLRTGSEDSPGVTARLSGPYSVTVIFDHFETARRFEQRLENSEYCTTINQEQVTRATGENDELESMERIENTLSDPDAIEELRGILNEVFTDTTLGATPCTAHDELGPQALAKTAVEILRGETCVIRSSTSRGCRGKDVMNIELCRVGERELVGEDPSSSHPSRYTINRGEIPGSQILREHSSNPSSSVSTRPKNYITETIALKIDDCQWDQSEDYATSPDEYGNVLRAALIRGLIEEVMRPLADHLQIPQDEDARDEAGRIASEWLSQGARFEDGFANTEMSRSVGLNSEYLMHYVRIILPSEPHGVDHDGAEQLLQHLHFIDEFPRDDDDGSLAWMPRTPNTSGLRAALWWRDGESQLIRDMQQHREGHLQITPFSNSPQSNIRDGPGDKTIGEWREIYAQHMTGEAAVNRRDEFEVDMFEQAIHHTWWENGGRAVIEGILNTSGQRQVTNPTKGAIRTAEIIHDIPCDECESEIGNYCNSDDPEELYSPDEHDIVYNIHEDRVRCSLQFHQANQRNLGRLFFQGASGRPQHPPYSMQPTELVEGCTLRSLDVVMEDEDGRPLSLERVSLCEQDDSVWEWDPQPHSPDDRSLDRGWWPPVHVNQTRRQLEAVAKALESAGFHRAVLRCEPPNGPAMALGLITPENLRLLAQNAIAYNEE